jgi:hypothetical protein
VFFILGDSATSEFEVPTFRNTSAHKFRTPVNHPQERIQHPVHGESLKSRTYKLLIPFVFPVMWKNLDVNCRFLPVDWMYVKENVELRYTQCFAAVCVYGACWLPTAYACIMYVCMYCMYVCVCIYVYTYI